MKSPDSTTPPATDQASPLPKPEGDKAPAADAKSPDSKTLLSPKPEPAGAPEKYEFKAPEGFEYQPEALEKATKTFKELGLSQAQANQVMSLYADEISKAENAPFKLWEDTQTKWRDEVKNDATLGPRLDQVKTNVSRMIDGLGDAKLTADFRAALEYTGAGNNPAFIRVFDKLSQMFAEGKKVAGSGPSALGQREPGSAPTSPAKAMYPNLP